MGTDYSLEDCGRKGDAPSETTPLHQLQKFDIFEGIQFPKDHRLF